MKEKIKITREELLEILGVTNNNLKTIIKRKQLYERLKQKGYIYIDKEKVGRNTLYILEKYYKTNEIESLNNICNGIFHTKKQKEFSNYYLYRILNLDKAITKELLSKLSEVSHNTITKWDKIMIENNIMDKDGFYYVKMTMNEDKPVYELTDKYEYSTFCKNKLILARRDKAFERYTKGEIDKITYDMIHDSATLSAYANEGKFVYRVTKYQLNKAGIDLTKMIKELIIKVYMIDLNKYFINLNQSV